VAALGSYIPRARLRGAQPAAALKAGDEQQAFARLRSPMPGVILLATGAALTALPPIAGLPIAGYAAIALLLIGTLLLLPRIAASALARVPRPRAFAGALAIDQLRGAGGQAGVSLATIVASVSLMVSMAIMVASFRQSLDDWLVRVLPADVYVRAGPSGDSAYLSPREQRALAAIPGVAAIAFLRVQSLVLDPAQPRVSLLARDMPRDDPGSALPLVGETHPSPKRGPAAGVDQRIGGRSDRLDARHARAAADRGQSGPFTVAGLWRDYARQQGPS
jgi:putative ABC transport system permease protein